MKRFILSVLAVCLTWGICTAANPKREFRGAWIQAVNHQFEGMPTADLKSELIYELESLSSAGINAILFQVRVECDALYKSEFEPWSAYLTGVQGQAPDEDWDPLQFMIEQCHKRGMELHAWINPYRAKTASTEAFADNHQMTLHPERIIPYGSLALLNPALKENRDYICMIAADIIRRYDIDGFHIDDYFYPYPDGDMKFKDDASFRNDPRGFTDKDDWRRDNVNLFVEQLYHTVKDLKPWVKFGISPFGIYRNRSDEYPDGSRTSGFENYSGLYADVLYWIEKGWMDYCIPQIYWNTGTKAADYAVLAEWWSEHSGTCPMYVGQDVERTVQGKDPDNSRQNQQRHKQNLERSLSGLQGNCFWPAKSVVNNPKDYRTVLAEEYHNTPALQPLSPGMPKQSPGKVRKVMILSTRRGPVLFWTAPKAKKELDKARRFVIYHFGPEEKINLEDPGHIVTVTSETFLELQPGITKEGGYFVITALNRLDCESAPVRYSISNHL